MKLFCRLLVALAVVVSAMGFNLQMKIDRGAIVKKTFGALAAGLLTISGLPNEPVQAITRDQLLSLSYQQVKGTGLANRCPEVIGEQTINLAGGKKYKITDLCVEPKSWQVEEEVGVKKGEPVKEFVNTKLMTRQTYSLDGVSGELEVKDGKAVFTEKDGIDYAATTVQLPGGERVPFLFSLKDLVAKSSSSGPIKPAWTSRPRPEAPTGSRAATARLAVRTRRGHRWGASWPLSRAMSALGVALPLSTPGIVRIEPAR